MKEKLRSDKIAAKELRALELQTIKDLSKLEKEAAKEQKELKKKEKGRIRSEKFRSKENIDDHK